MEEAFPPLAVTQLSTFLIIKYRGLGHLHFFNSFGIKKVSDPPDPQGVKSKFKSQNPKIGISFVISLGFGFVIWDLRSGGGGNLLSAICNLLSVNYIRKKSIISITLL